MPISKHPVETDLQNHFVDGGGRAASFDELSVTVASFRGCCSSRPAARVPVKQLLIAACITGHKVR